MEEKKKKSKGKKQPAGRQRPKSKFEKRVMSGYRRDKKEKKKQPELKMAFLSAGYEEFLKKQEASTGVLSTKTLKPRNKELRD